ncbi:hypothetical protein, partial [Acidiphilium sp.]|uniref:hypothetical protein n=1 Tax=Acidiphilium sp. TaxID=527 RepID=UPI00258B57AE
MSEGARMQPRSSPIGRKRIRCRHQISQERHRSFLKKRDFPGFSVLLLRYRNDLGVRNHGPFRQSFLTLKEG